MFLCVYLKQQQPRPKNPPNKQRNNKPLLSPTNQKSKQSKQTKTKPPKNFKRKTTSVLTTLSSPSQRHHGLQRPLRRVSLGPAPPPSCVGRARCLGAGRGTLDPAPLPFPGSPRAGAGGRWGAPALHARPRPRSRPQSLPQSLPQSRPQSQLQPLPESLPQSRPQSRPQSQPQPRPAAPSPDRSAASVEPGPRSEGDDAPWEAETGPPPSNTSNPRRCLSPVNLHPGGKSVPNHTSGGVVYQRQWEAVSPLCTSCGISPRIGNWQRLGRRL